MKFVLRESPTESCCTDLVNDQTTEWIMQKKYETCLFISIGLVIVISLLLYVRNIFQEKEHKEKQAILAATMNVSLADDPNLPDDYFPKVLKPGMTLEEAHEILVGYEKVSYDYEPNSLAYYEIYCYFDADTDRADRIMIMYDRDFSIEKIEQEDPQSKTLTTGGWPEGQLVRR
jgi:hypothetical protein